MTDRYDAFVLLSFGGPEGPDDVLPFLQNVTRGRGVPAERLTEVGKHYLALGGASPINDQNRALLGALRAEFDRRGFDLPCYWGNRNWHPYLSDTVRRMRADGVRRALGLATSGYASYSACRQYREDIARATDGEPVIEKLRHFFNHPGFVAANADGVRAALGRLPDHQRAAARLVYTAHSVPEAMAATSGPAGNLYAGQVAEAASLVTEAVDPGRDFDLVWQSRSGPPSVRWLAPDINDHLTVLAGSGVPAVVVAPVGFVSDHMEVVWDLDHEAADTAKRLGLQFARAATAGTHPEFVAGIGDLVAERLTSAPARSLGDLGPAHLECPAGCCPAPRRPAASGMSGGT